ncbi:hypothetical protein LCGC14_0951560 [marine sediment metagenome]|uniref:Tyr recombinase domain-containing protein n=1 Tax=marine sediment metagenome TaxID=412755 RepID=A0A0F9P382_9ZZZZ
MSIPKTLTPDQCVSLLEELRISQGTKKKQVQGIRNYAMAMVMLETGLRVGELCGLIVADLWFSDEPVNFLVVREKIAKNHKERHIPISLRLRETIELMRASLWTTEILLSNMFAFPTRDAYTPLSTRTVERIILEAGLSAFNLVVTPHMLRHTFGSRMMRKTNARIVQALLGHESLQSTQIYMHPNSEDLRKAIDS